MVNRILGGHSDELTRQYWDIRDRVPNPGSSILVLSGCGGEMPVLYGSDEYERLAEMYGDRLSWRYPDGFATEGC